MKIVDTMAKTVAEKRPLRRQYSGQLKAQIVGECRQDGASVAGVALSHGINANIVHRWLREHANGALVVQTPREFVPVKLNEPALPVGNTDREAEADIRVEVRRGSSAIVVSWPLQGASSCAAWLREWLK